MKLFAHFKNKMKYFFDFHFLFLLIQQQEIEPTVTPPRRDDRNFNSGDRVTSPSMSEKKQSSSLQRLLESHHQERLQQQAQRDVELAGDPTNADDVFLSAR